MESPRNTLLLRQFNVENTGFALTAKERRKQKQKHLCDLCVPSRFIPIFSRRIHNAGANDRFLPWPISVSGMKQAGRMLHVVVDGVGREPPLGATPLSRGVPVLPSSSPPGVSPTPAQSCLRPTDRSTATGRMPVLHFVARESCPRPHALPHCAFAWQNRIAYYLVKRSTS